MSFPFHLPKEDGQTRRFDPAGATANIYHVYSVPEGAEMLQILALGGGGGGGFGFGAAAGTARGGGGGGGAGALCRIIVPTALLPKSLYVYAGIGGNPAGGGGTSGVAVQPANISQAWLIGSTGGGSGGSGTASTVGAAGIAGAVWTSIYTNLGVSATSVGTSGASGGSIAGAVGAVISFGTGGLFVSGGAGGGGTTSADFGGGGIAGAGLCPTISGAAAGSNPGNAGFELWLPPTFSGGSGGGSSNAGAGGAGGAGARGSGGGGGGGGVTSGAGGRGGDGFVLITALF